MFSVKLKERGIFWKKQTNKKSRIDIYSCTYIYKNGTLVCLLFFFWAILSSHGVDTDDGAR